MAGLDIAYDVDQISHQREASQVLFRRLQNQSADIWSLTHMTLYDPISLHSEEESNVEQF
jgi:hypothetical protein